jgi:hypothetical protein
VTGEAKHSDAVPSAHRVYLRCRVVLKVSSGYFPVKQQLAGLCSGDVF